MSSSDPGKRREWGAVYMGTTTLSLASVEGETSQTWTPADEEGYLERVRVKATEMATSLVEEARREAEAIRRQAQEEGYQSGLHEAEAELEAFRAAMSDSVSAVLSAIEGQRSAIFARWREDLVAVLRLAVEKGVGMALSGDRAALLENCYVQAVSALENRRNLVIRVNAEDEPAIADIVAVTQARYPDLKAWSVKADPSVAPGGLMVESDDSLADNRVEKRTALVNEILRDLMLPAE